MVSQNKGNVSGIENSLKALVGHLFGNHECCSSSWCGYQRDKAYQHSKLPYGKDLISQDLKKDLEKLFLGNLMNQAKKLANLSSSQANESLNNTIAFKSPKAKHYSASASLSYRFGTAVLQNKWGIFLCLQGMNVQSCILWKLFPNIIFAFSVYYELECNNLCYYTLNVGRWIMFLTRLSISQSLSQTVS